MIKLATRFFSSALVGLLALGALTSTAWAQSTGDYRSAALGNWNNVATWETYNGSSWVAATSPPGAADPVFLEGGHTVTLTQNEACKDLNLNTTSGQERIVTQQYSLSVNGKLRAYTGSAPGSNDSPAGGSTWINTAGLGKIVFVGDSRSITSSGEWGANPPGWNVDFSLTSGQTGTLQTHLKAGTIRVVSGTVDAGGNDIRPDEGPTGTGSLEVVSGATLRVGSGKIQRTATASSTSHFDTFYLWGNLVYYSSSVGAIGAATISNGGSVEYSASGAQTLVSKGGNSGGTDFSIYNDLKLSGSGTKTLSSNTTINGKLTLAGTAALSSGSSTLSYTGGSSIEYDGSVAQTTTNAELPPSTYLKDLVIKNPLGVTLHASRDFAGSVTVEENASLTIPSGTTLSAADGATLSGTVAGGNPSSSILLLSSSYDNGNLIFPPESPGGTLSNVRLQTSGTYFAIDFSGICNLQSGASFVIDNSSTIRLTESGTVSGGTINVMNSGKLDVNGSDLTLNGVTVNLTTSGSVLETYGGGSVTTEGTTSIDQGGAFSVPLVVNSGVTSASGVNPFTGSITIASSGTLNVPATKSLTLENDLVISGVLSGGDATSTLKLWGSGEGSYSVTLTDAVVSIAHVDIDDDGNGRDISGTGTFTGSTVKLDAGSGLELTGSLTITGGTIQIVYGSIDIFGWTLTLDGVSLNITSDGQVVDNEGGGNVVTEGSTTIDQGGAFDVPLEVSAGTTTASGTNSFQADMTVRDGATLTVPVGKTLTQDNGRMTVEEGATIAGPGSFTFIGEGTIFENNGTISVATTLEEGEGDPHILGDGTWSNLTIPSGTVVYVDADMAMRSSSVTNQGWLVIDDYAFTFDGGTFTNEGTVSSEWDSFECEGDVTLTQNGSFRATLVILSGTTTTSGTYSDPIIVKPGGVLSIPGGETLAAEAKVIVERASASSYGTIGGAGSLAFSAYRDTLTNDGAVSASTIFENVEGGLYYIAGNGAWGDVFIEPYVEVKLSGNVAMENANLTIEGIGSLNTQWNTLLLKGTSAVNVEVQPSASITGGGVTVQTQGIVNIVQNGTFDESLQVLGGTTTAEGQFQKLIIVHDGATLTIPATKTLTATDSVRVDGGTTGGAITGAGSLMFYGYRRTFTNDGLVSAPTTFVDNDGDWKKIDGTGYWSSLTIAGRCSTNVGYTLILTGAPTPLTVGISLQTSGQTIIYKGTSPQTVAPIPYNNLEINNSAGASLGAASAVGGNLALTSGQFNVGSNLTLGSGASITRKVGSLTGTPTFGSSIDVSYIGTVAVTTGPEIPNASTTLIGLTINNSGGVTLGSPVTVNGTLSVAGGNLITAADTVKLAEFATITETAPYSVLGKLNTARTCTTFAAQDFGGMGLEIGPASVAPGLTKVTRVTGAASTLPTGPSILRYFDISPATNTGLGATMVFHYRDPQDLNGRDESKFVLFKSTNSATTWTAQACTLDASANRITMYGVGSFSRWTAGESYPVPTLTSISPTSGSLGGTLNVNLTGSGYVAGATTVYFDTSITVNSVTVNSDTSLTANITISAGTSAGLRNVSVTNPSPGGGTGTLPSAFNVIAGNPIPTLSSIAPTTVGLGATANIVLTGTGFANGISTPSFGGDITVNSFTVNSPTQITANITVSSSASLGARNVSVTNVPPGGGTGTLTNGLTLEYPAPAIGSITPNSASRGQTLAVTIIGEGYFSGVTAVNFGPNVIVNSLIVTGVTQLTANITIGAAASTGLRSVTVSNSSPGGGSTTWENAFTINNPTPALSSVSPTSGNRGQTLTVVLRGSNFVSGLSTVSFGPDITVNSTTVDSASKITVGITIGPGAATGSRDVTVTHPAPGGGTATLAVGFAVGNPSPTVAGVAPNTGGRGETINVTLTGLNFINGVSSASFGAGITVNSSTVNSATQITVNVTIAADAALGSRDVSVNNTAPGGGTSTLSGAFTVNNPAPTLASITPTSGNRGQTLNVTVTGTNFIPGVTTPAYGSGITVNSVSSFTSTQVTASVTIDIGATPGPRDITVTNAAPGGGTATLSGAFTVTNPSPTLTSISPNRAGRGSRINVVVTGTNFLDGVSSVSFGSDVTVNSTTITSATQITVNISIALSAATGARNVSVTNATPGGGTATLTGGFTVDTSPATSVENTLSAIPEEYVLQEAYPNPFNPSTRIRYGLPEQSRVKLEVYNMLGNVVAELVSGERSKGLYEVEWRAENLPSGVYLVRVFSESVETSKRFIASRKVVLVK